MKYTNVIHIYTLLITYVCENRFVLLQCGLKC